MESQKLTQDLRLVFFNSLLHLLKFALQSVLSLVLLALLYDLLVVFSKMTQYFVHQTGWDVPLWYKIGKDFS